MLVIDDDSGIQGYERRRTPEKASCKSNSPLHMKHGQYQDQDQDQDQIPNSPLHQNKTTTV